MLLCAQLDASEAAHQAQAAAYRRVVGRGGLNEEAAEDTAGGGSTAAAAAGRFGGGVIGPSAGAGARRADAAVSEAQVVRHPSEAERVLRLLQQQISKLGMTRWAAVLAVVLCQANLQCALVVVLCARHTCLHVHWLLCVYVRSLIINS